jgi:hypothetical protein
MPKDATKNVDRYKIRGGQLNEFEYTENQKALAGKKSKGGAKLIPGTPPEEAGEGLKPAVKGRASNATKGTQTTRTTKGGQSKKAAQSTGKKSTKTTKKANNASTKGATAKKLAARKATKK